MGNHLQMELAVVSSPPDPQAHRYSKTTTVVLAFQLRLLGGGVTERYTKLRRWSAVVYHNGAVMHSQYLILGGLVS